MKDNAARPIYLAVVFIAAFMPLLFFWFFAIRPYYYPSGDEIALLVSSGMTFHPRVLLWFTQGFSEYFLAYGGAPHSTNFIRPVANATYLMNSFLFGTNWSYYLLSTYVIQAGLVTVSFQSARRFLALGRNASFVVGALVFLSPASGLQEFAFPSFAFDLLGALLVLGGLLCLWDRRYCLGWVLLTIALFTKETTLFAPIVTAALVAFGWRCDAAVPRRAGYVLCWLAPVLLWWSVRHHAFRNAVDGIYVLPPFTMSVIAKGVLHGVLAWPFGMRTVNQGHGPQIMLFLFNACFWCSAAVMFRLHPIHIIADEQRSAYRFDVRSQQLALGIYTSGALVLPVFLSLPLRFGASFFPLLILFLASIIMQTNARIVRQWAIVTLILLGIDGLYQKIVEPLSLASLRSRWELSASQVTALSDTQSRTVLLLDDATGGLTTPSLIAAFAHFDGEIVRLNNLEGLTTGACEKQPEVHAALFGSQLHLSSQLSAHCGYYAFDGLPPELSDAPHQKQIRSGAMQMAFALPGVAPLHAAGTPQMTGELKITVTGFPEGITILVPNFSERKYRWLNYSFSTH
jgi:hypothetical protein